MDRLRYCPRVARWISAVSDCGLRFFVGRGAVLPWRSVSVNVVRSISCVMYMPKAKGTDDENAAENNRIANGCNLFDISKLGSCELFYAKFVGNEAAILAIVSASKSKKLCEKANCGCGLFC